MRCWHLESELENLGEHDYSHDRVSPPTRGPVGYNCIAWAAGTNTQRWWPSKTRKFYYYWPPHLPREDHQQETLENFIRAFEWRGYRRCWNVKLEQGVEKVAIFIGPRGNPLHAARQLPSGTCTSKCGDYEDIEHTRLDAVAGKQYGKPVAFLKRRLDGEPFIQDRILLWFRRLFPSAYEQQS